MSSRNIFFLQYACNNSTSLIDHSLGCLRELPRWYEAICKFFFFLFCTENGSSLQETCSQQDYSLFQGFEAPFWKQKRAWDEIKPNNICPTYLTAQKCDSLQHLGALKLGRWLYLPSVLWHLDLLLTVLLCYWFNTPASSLSTFHAFGSPAFLPLPSALQCHLLPNEDLKENIDCLKLESWKEYAMQLFSQESFSCML